MRLYISDNSPYARIVRVFLHEIGKGDEVEEARVNPRDPATGFWKVNPVARIPALEVEEGLTIVESDLILRFFDSRFAQGRHYARLLSEPREAALLGLAQSVLDRGVLARTEKLRPAGPDSDNFISTQLDGVKRGCDALNRTAPEEVREPSVVDIVVACTVAWLDFRHPEIEVRANRPRLSAWCGALEIRSSMTMTRPV